MRERLLLKCWASLMLILFCVLSSSCSVIKDRPATQDLSLALAGMVGSDEMSFKGTSMMTQDGQVLPESVLFYGGTVQEHTKVKLYTLLPDSASTTKKATKSTNEVKSRGSSMKPYYSQLEKKEGKWEVQATGDLTQEDHSLYKLNPLQQLEALESVGKSIREEGNAGRGANVLRIELTPTEARDQLSAELEREMLQLRPKASQAAEDNTTEALKVTKALMKLWQKQNDDLQEKLKQADVETVYHLTIDKKNNLPRRLTLNRKISYKGENNNVNTESYTFQVDFSGYR